MDDGSAKGRIEEINALFDEAFLRLYGELCLKEISVERLSREAGYSRAAFYRYFHSVADVLDRVENNALPERESCFICDNVDSITPKLFINLYLRYFATKERELRILLDKDTGDRFYCKLADTILPAFRALLEHKGDLSDGEIGRLSQYLVETKLNQMKSWAKNPDVPLDEYMRLPLETVEKAFWDGL